MIGLQSQPGAPRYLIDDMIEDLLDRIGFVRLKVEKALIVGDFTGRLAVALGARGASVITAEPADGLDEERPLEEGGFDLIASLGTLDTVNDLPGALIHIRTALTPGGMAVISFAGAGSLPALRAAMLEADGERPAPRIHPQIDVRAGAQLLQRAGFADPVADSRTLEVRFGSLGRLVSDLRAQGLSNVLDRPGRPLGKSGVGTAAGAFADRGVDGRGIESFEIITLTGWKR
jgi:SAM-dependent methyltransferase